MPGLVYLVAALSVTTTLDLTLLIILSSGLMLHTAIVTGIARTSEPSRNRLPLLLLPLAPCVPLLLLGSVEPWATGIFGIVLAIWLGRIVTLLMTEPPRVVPAVLVGSAIALLDAFYLAMLEGRCCRCASRAT